MSQKSAQPAKGAPQLNKQEAIQYFLDGIKPISKSLIGVESEIFIVDPKTYKMVGFDTVEKVLMELSKRFGWERIEEDNRTIALERGAAMIAIEPGGQLEYATAPHSKLTDVRDAFEAYYKELRQVGKKLEVNFLSIGLHPTADFSRTPIVPKARYKIMAPRLEEEGALAHYMMRGTTSWQCALDYHSEADFALKFRTAMHISSLTSAIFANSPWEKGERTNFVSNRMNVWMKTDPARCGLIRQVFDDQFSFEEYYDYARKIPMLFIMREDNWINVRGRTFEQFMKNGFQYNDKTEHAAFEDWILHLSTIFPEARLKQFIEIRCADSGSFENLPAFPGIYWGIFSENSLMEAAIDLTRKLSWDDRMDFHVNVGREGLNARVGRIKAAELAAELLQIAHAGLVGREQEGEKFLDPLIEFVGRVLKDPTKQNPPEYDPKYLKPFLLLSK